MKRVRVLPYMGIHLSEYELSFGHTHQFEGQQHILRGKRGLPVVIAWPVPSDILPLRGGTQTRGKISESESHQTCPKPLKGQGSVGARLRAIGAGRNIGTLIASKLAPTETAIHRYLHV